MEQLFEVHLAEGSTIERCTTDNYGGGYAHFAHMFKCAPKLTSLKFTS
jgi:hypothetical protein